ncbi:hypothetical protein [Pantoea agglomerans]
MKTLFWNQDMSGWALVCLVLAVGIIVIANIIVSYQTYTEESKGNKHD